MTVVERSGSDLTEGSQFIGLPEAEDSAAVVAQRPAGHLSRVGGEAAFVADVAPESPLKDLQAAVLVPGAGTAIHKARRAIHFCTTTLSDRLQCCTVAKRLVVDCSTDGWYCSNHQHCKLQY